jgi:hypothetical protein
LSFGARLWPLIDSESRRRLKGRHETALNPAARGNLFRSGTLARPMGPFRHRRWRPKMIRLPPGSGRCVENEPNQTVATTNQKIRRPKNRETARL